MYRKFLLLAMAVCLMLGTIGMATAAVDSVVISPTSAGSVSAKGTVQFSAKAYAQAVQVTSAKFVWSCNSSAGKISSKGKFTANTVPGNYPAAVTVTVSGTNVKASADVTITPGPASKMLITPSTVSLSCGSTQQFSASVTDAYGNALSDASVTWSVKTTAGSISTDGLFTAGAKLGKYSGAVTATCGKAKGKASVTVLPTPPSTVKLFVNKVDVTSGYSAAAGAKVTFAAKGYDSLGQEISGLKYTYATGGEIGTISASSGAFTAVKTSGKSGVVTARAIINSQAVGATGSCAVTLVPGTASKVVITPASVSVACGDTTAFSASAADSFGNVVSGGQITWSVSNAKAGAIDSTGLFTAGSTPGKYSNSVVATLGKLKGKASVTVTPPPPSSVKIFLSKTDVTDGVDIAAASKVTFSAKAYDSLNREITGLKFTYGIEGSGIGTISSTTGKFTASNVSGQTAVITAQALINSQAVGEIGSCEVTIVPGTPKTAVISPNPATVEIGDTVQFTLSVTDAYGNTSSDAKATWSVTNNNAGTIVADTGLFTAGATVANYPNAVKATTVIGKKTVNATVNVQANTGTVITGRILDSSSSSPIANVVITFGTYTTTTRADGNFTINLGDSTAAVALGGSVTFSIDLSNAGANYDNELSLINYIVSDLSPYGHYQASEIAVPTAVLGGTETDLGTMTIDPVLKPPSPPGS